MFTIWNGVVAVTEVTTVGIWTGEAAAFLSLSMFYIYSLGGSELLYYTRLQLLEAEGQSILCLELALIYYRRANNIQWYEWEIN